jgi:hypothetical protein
MLAFGADEVVMGPYSELGPIDAQIKIVESGVENFVSAAAFVDVLDDLDQRIRKEESTGSGPVSQSLLVQLAAINRPFVEHCRRLQLYAIDFAVRWMKRYALRDEPPEDAQNNAILTANELLQSGTFSHGQMLTAKDLRRNPQIHLKITELEKSDPLWQLIWKVYCASEVLFNMGIGSNLSKLFESQRTTFPVQ